MTSPTPDAATQRYVALIRGFWAQEVAADQIVNGVNLAARVCLGLPRDGSPTNMQLIDPKVCRQRAVAILAAHQSFLSNLGTTPAPPSFVADDQVFRTQLPKTIADLKLLIAACTAGSQQAVLDASMVYAGDMQPDVTDALDDVDPTVVHR